MSEAGTAAPPASSAGDGKGGHDDREGKDLETCQWQLFDERDANGGFFSDRRRRRKPQASTFHIISYAQPADGIDTEPPGSSSCTTLTTVTAASSMPSHDIHVRSMSWLVPGTYVDIEDAHGSMRAAFLARSLSDKHWDVKTPTSFGTVRQHDSLSAKDINEVLRLASDDVQVCHKSTNRLS